jgi:hypothetical protein
VEAPLRVETTCEQCLAVIVSAHGGGFYHHFDELHIMG